MTKFEQLREGVSERIELEKAYWDSLQEVANKFGHGFVEFLGMESNKAIDLNGEPLGIVRVGHIKDGRFELCPPWKHERDGRKLSFHVFLSLPGKESMSAEISICLKVNISKPDAEGVLLAISTDSMRQPLLLEEGMNGYNLDRFYDEFFEELLDKIHIKSL